MDPLSSKSPVSKSKAGMDYNEIKSHSSLLSNERIAILFFRLDEASIMLNQSYKGKYITKVRAVLYQVYKNIRSLIRNHGQVRADMNLDTKDPGVYTTDIAFDLVDQMIMYCEFFGYTYKKAYIITQHLNQLEIIIRDVLQYFSYFFRPDFKQKPDVMTAADSYKKMADKMTVEQLKQVAGRSHQIDFGSIEDKRDNESE